MYDVIKGTSFRPLHDNIFVTDLDSGTRQSAGGILIPDDNMTTQGIRTRVAKVWMVGPEVDYLQPNEYVMISHGRWTLSINLELDGVLHKVWKIDNDAILLVCDEDPRTSLPTPLPDNLNKIDNGVSSKAPKLTIISKTNR